MQIFLAATRPKYLHDIPYYDSYIVKGEGQEFPRSIILRLQALKRWLQDSPLMCRLCILFVLFCFVLFQKAQMKGNNKYKRRRVTMSGARTVQSICNTMAMKSELMSEND